MSVDYSQLEDFRKRMQDVKEKQVEEFMDSCCKELAARLIAKVVKKTPVDSGYLRKGWTGGVNQSAKKYVASLPIAQNGKNYEITVSNPIEYAPYIEYGHRVKKKDGYGWAKEHRMLTVSVEEIEKAKDGILEKKLQKFMKGAFGS